MHISHNDDDNDDPMNQKQSNFHWFSTFLMPESILALASLCSSQHNLIAENESNIFSSSLIVLTYMIRFVTKARQNDWRPSQPVNVKK